MENTNSALLPHILESLNRKPEYCDTYANLQDEIKIIFSSDNLDTKLYRALDKAIDVGQSLGIITMTNDIVRIPFSYAKGTACPTVLKKTEPAEEGIQKEKVVTQPRRTHTVKPNVTKSFRPKSQKRRSSRRRRSRRSKRRR